MNYGRNDTPEVTRSFVAESEKRYVGIEEGGCMTLCSIEDVISLSASVLKYRFYELGSEVVVETKVKVISKPVMRG